MNLLQTIPEEDEIRRSIIDYRISKGFKCTGCNRYCKQYWLEKQSIFRCSHCRHVTTLKSGTIFQSTKLSFRQWYIAIHIMCDPKKCTSAVEMQMYLGIKCYRTVHELMHKIRNLMSQYELSRLKKNIDYYVRTKRRMNLRDKNENKKKQNLLIHNEKSEKGHYRISIISCGDMKKYKPGKCARKSMARSHRWLKREVRSAPLHSFDDLKYWKRTHYQNFEKNVVGVYHGISSKYRQLFLDEFCFKTNHSMAGEDAAKNLFTFGIERTWWG